MSDGERANIALIPSLDELVHSAGMTYKDVAAKVGCHPSLITAYSKEGRMKWCYTRSRPFVLAIAEAIVDGVESRRRDVNHWLLSVNVAPVGMLEAYEEGTSMDWKLMPEELSSALMRISRIPRHRQKEIADVVRREIG